MKKIMSFMVVALSVLMASSCTKENAGRSDEATMTLSLSIPEAAVTKAYGDGMYDAKNLIIGIFDENGVEKSRRNLVWEKDVFEQEIQIRFIMGKK